MLARRTDGQPELLAPTHPRIVGRNVWRRRQPYPAAPPKGLICAGPSPTTGAVVGMRVRRAWPNRASLGAGRGSGVAVAVPDGSAAAETTGNSARTASRSASIVGQLGLTAAANLATMALGAVTGLIAARILGPVGEGQLTAIQTWPMLLGTLAMLGQPEAIVYFIAREPERGREITSTAVLVGLTSALAVAGAAWFALPGALAAQQHAVVRAARFFLLVGVVYAVFGLPHAALRGAQAFRAWNLLRVAPTLAWLAVLAASQALGAAAPIPLSRWYLAGVSAVGLVGWVAAVRVLRGPVRPRAGRVGPLLRFGLPSVLLAVPQSVNIRLDQLFIIALLPARDLGLYVVAVAWSAPTGPLLAAVGSVLYPRLAASPSAEDKGRLLQLGLQGAVLAGVPIVVVLLVAAPFGLPFVYGTRFAGAVASSLLLVPAGAVLAWAGSAEEVLRGLGRPVAVLVAELFAAAVTLAALPVLLHLLGIVGAALASLLGYSALAAGCARAICQTAGVRPASLAVPSRELRAVIAAARRDAIGRLRR